MQKSKVCVVGLGYIGLPTAALLNANVVNTINQGRIHIMEPDLDNFVRSAVAVGKLQAYLKPQAADIYMICVPTPFYEGDDIPEPNIDFVLSATRSIAGFVKPGDIVILESTSPVGTTEKMAQTLLEVGVDVAKIHIAYCPERVLPGKIMTELIDNDRVIGGLTSEATKVVGDFYRTFVRGSVLETDARTAEMCKLTENSFRDLNIAFANELSLICAREGINVWKLIQLANHHPRVNILQPGAGVGGHCIAVDPWFIVARDKAYARLIRTAREVNNYKTIWVIDQIKLSVADASTRTSNKPKVACLGLAFKPNIDDLRESPALQIATYLQDQGYDVVAVEPNIEVHDQIKLVTLDVALKTADVIVALVKHKQFINPTCINKLKESNSLDFCGLEF
jgi:UDP-N-acetyl-D-mannosaminuronic acid dehydrogenase